ncbi:MAG: hypothetical protein EOM54_01525 [Clostridia bacterium]|nr:hypothetical protein [Clostridia bacterium]
MRTGGKDSIFVLFGLILAAGGLVLIKIIPDPQGIMQALPYICLGVGCGVFGQGMGNILGRMAARKAPGEAKKIEIEANDERNIAIANRAKARAYDIMIFVFGALMLSFALMGTDLMEVLLLSFAYLFVVFSGVYYRAKYEKEM